jgi:hypothetical protein
MTDHGLRPNHLGQSASGLVAYCLGDAAAKEIGTYGALGLSSRTAETAVAAVIM